MTHYSDNPAHVRVDFFKPENGTWYMTEVLDMSGLYNELLGPYEAVAKALAKTRHNGLLHNWIILVQEPYHINAYPVLLMPGRASYTPWPSHK